MSADNAYAIEDTTVYIITSAHPGLFATNAFRHRSRQFVIFESSML